MRLAAADPMDVYFAFRLAFSDLPDVRIRTEDLPSVHARGRGRFLPAPGTATRVFLRWATAREWEALAPGDLEGKTQGHPRFVHAWALGARRSWASDTGPDGLTRDVLEPWPLTLAGGVAFA